MTIVLKMNVNTNNNNLPRAHSMDIDDILGAWWFDEANPVDLSGAGATYEVVGTTPTRTAYGVIASSSAYLKTSIYETSSMTLMGVARSAQSVTSTSSRFVIGNYDDDVRGTSIHLADTSGGDDYDALALSTGFKSSDTTYPPVFGSVDLGVYADRSKFRFWAGVVDATANRVYLYMPHLNGATATTFTPGAGVDLATRPLTQNDGGLLRIGAPVAGGSAAVEVLEARAYGVAKSGAQILAEYEVAKAYWQNIHGINLAAA